MFGYRRNQGIVELVTKILRREVVKYEDVDEEGWMGEGRKGEVLGFVGYRSKYEEKEEEEEVEVEGGEEKEGNVVLEGVSQFIAVDDGNDDGSRNVYKKKGNDNVSGNVSKGECKCRCKCNQYQQPQQLHQPPQQFQQHDKHPPPQHDTVSEVRKSVVSNHKPKLGVQNMSHSHSNIISMNFNQIHNKHNKQSKTTLKRVSCAPFFHFGDKQQQQRVVIPQPDRTSNTNITNQPTSTSLQQRQWFNLQNIKSSSVILPKRVSKSKAFQMYYCIDKAYTPELKAKYPKHPVMSKVSRNHITTSNNNDVVVAGSNTISNNNNNVLTTDKLMCEVSNVESSNIHSSTSSSFILEQSKESEREQQREEKRNVERYYYKVGSHYHDKELMMVVNNTRLTRGRGDDEREKVVRRYGSKERSYSSEESHRKRKKKEEKYKERRRKISIPKRKKQQQQPCIDLVSEDLMKQYSNIITIY